jgi:hypothetical protein
VKEQINELAATYKREEAIVKTLLKKRRPQLDEEGADEHQEIVTRAKANKRVRAEATASDLKQKEETRPTSPL